MEPDDSKQTAHRVSLADEAEEPTPLGGKFYSQPAHRCCLDALTIHASKPDVQA